MRISDWSSDVCSSDLGNLQYTGHLFGRTDGLAVMAAFAKQGLRTCFLEIAGSDLTAWNVCGDGQHRCHTPMSIVQSINQMHVTRSATACTTSQFAGQLRFGPCGECCRLDRKSVV